MTMRSRRLYFVMAVAIAAIPSTGCKQLQAVFAPRPSEHMPAYKPVDVQTISQNWSPDERKWFYHASQGTELVPYKWFLALEQPHIKVFGPVPKFSDPSYLARFGFLPDPANPHNQGDLPVGFAVDTVVDPNSNQAVEVVGLTCAPAILASWNIRVKESASTVERRP